MNTRQVRLGESTDNLGTPWNYAPPAGGISNSTADVAVRAAQAGKRNYITRFSFSVGVALATASEIVLKDGATVLFRMSLPAATLIPTMIDFDPPLVGSINTAVNMAAVTNFATGNFVGNLDGYTV